VSLVYIDGFDWIVNATVGFDGPGRWGGAGSTNQFIRVTDTASGTGAACSLRSTSAEMTHGFTAGATMVVGFRFRIESTFAGQAVVMEFNQGGFRQVELRLNGAGTFQAYSGGSSLGAAGTFVMPTATWTYVEYKVFIHASTGTAELRINGSPTPDIDLTGLDTHTTGSAEVDSITLLGNSSIDLEYDDLYLDDSTFHGDVFVETLVADGVGTDADFTPFVGANWEEVDELPTDNDTTYNESSVVDDRDRFTHTDLPADTDVVLGVQVGIWCKKTVAGDRELRTLAHDGVTEGEGAAHVLSTDYTWFTDMFEDHPTGAAAWTESEVNAGQFGYTVES
jgi:hypothetical protein